MIPLLASSRDDMDARAEPITVRFRSAQPQPEPVIAFACRIAKQEGCFTDTGNDRVDTAVSSTTQGSADCAVGLFVVVTWFGRLILLPAHVERVPAPSGG